MPTITASKSTYARLAERATIPGVMTTPEGSVKHPDGSVTFAVDDEVAERLAAVNPDLDKALVEMLDALDSGQTLARPN